MHLDTARSTSVTSALNPFPRICSYVDESSEYLASIDSANPAPAPSTPPPSATLPAAPPAACSARVSGLGFAIGAEGLLSGEAPPCSSSRDSSNDSLPCRNQTIGPIPHKDTKVKEHLWCVPSTITGAGNEKSVNQPMLTIDLK